MIVLTESNNPFKDSLPLPEEVQNLMEEYKLDFAMFDEAIGESENSSYMYALLYEAEIAWNSLYTKLLNEDAIYYLHEADEPADKRTFWQSFKQFIANLLTGIANFFRRIWAAIANDQQLFMQASRSIPPNATSKPLYITPAEAQEFKQIMSKFNQERGAQQAELDTLYKQEPINEAAIKALQDKMKATDVEFNKALTDFENKRKARHDSQQEIGQAEIVAALQNSVSKILSPVLKDLEGISNKTSATLSGIQKKGESNAANITVNTQQTQNDVSVNNQAAVTTNASITLAAKTGQELISSVSSASAKTYQYIGTASKELKDIADQYVNRVNTSTQQQEQTQQQPA